MEMKWEFTSWSKPFIHSPLIFKDPWLACLIFQLSEYKNRPFEFPYKRRQPSAGGIKPPGQALVATCGEMGTLL